MKFVLDIQLFASKKGVGSTKNGRDSESKRLGAKLADGQFCHAGSIIYRQRGTKIHPGTNVGKGGDDTLFAKEMESLLSGVKNMLPTVVPAAETAGLAVMSFLWSMKERQHCWICATTARWLQSRAGTERQRKCMVPMGQTALSRCRRVRL